VDPGIIIGVFIGWPTLALLPALMFGIAGLRFRQTSAWLACGAWAAYFPYEMAMKLRLLCSGECNIRIDLLLLYPLLILLSIRAVVAILRHRRVSPPH
jgi:hypothetical protein